MRIHHFSNGCSSWDQHDSLSLNCKRLRPLAPKLSGPSSPPSSSSGITSAIFDLKSFIKPHNDFPVDHKGDPSQVETHPGGTRWNPTQEQIGILEMLYRSGMRTPNAQQIEHITSQLGQYGKIEGKNVFYWFQNHKARERQKQKRNSLSSQSTFKTRTSLSLDLSRESTVEKESCEEIANKRTCRSWGFENLEIERKINNGTGANICIHNVTLELFPLHPEAR